MREVDDTRPMTVTEWAAIWRVHRNTASKRLARLRERFGDGVVQRVGNRLRATRKAVRAVMDGPSEDWVTQSQFSLAMREIWAAVRELQRTRH